MTGKRKILYVIPLAISEATRDAARIKAGKVIEHVKRWFLRAVVVFVMATMVELFALLWNETPPWKWTWEVIWNWRFAFTLIACAALFASLFRAVLNRKRGLDFRYVSPSSAYDRVFLRMFNGEWGWAWDRILANNLHGKMYEVGGAYMQHVHRAGALMYCVEAAVVIGWVVMKLI